MRRTVVALSWTLAGLVACERTLSIHERSERGARSRLRRLVPAVLLEGKSIAAVRLEDTGRREAVLYARTSGGWRCLSRAGAPADEARLNAFIEQVLEAQGVLQRRDSEREGRFGLDPPALLRVSLHGPRVLQDRTHDLIAVAEIGATLPGRRGTYARSGSSHEVIAVDADLRHDLTWPQAKGLAPLQDPRIVPEAWPGAARVERIEVFPAGAAAFQLQKRERVTRREDLMAGALPWEWVLAVGGREQVAPAATTAYVRFLHSATYDRALDPRGAEGLGLARPRARVVLHASAGPPVEIQIGAAAPAGGIAVRNVSTQTAFAVQAEVAALLAPPADVLRRAATSNAWDAWLQSERRPTSPGPS